MRRSYLLGIFLLLDSYGLRAKEHLTIISPHRKSIQDEFIPKFEAYYKQAFKEEIEVEWLDQGGSGSNLKFVKSRFESNPKEVKIDLFWGGGELTFIELERLGYLEPLNLNANLLKELPANGVGILLRSKNNTWIASALSSFGIFYNKKLLDMQKLPHPQVWSDLARPHYFNNLSLADPRKSSTSLVMNLIVLKVMGWQKGWEVLTAMAANTKKFTHSSSEPIKAVVAGEAPVATSIDFYANEKVSSLGAQNLGFILPKEQTIFNADPVAMLKGASNAKGASRFIEYILSAPAQKILFMRKGEPSGPEFSDLGRMAVNPVAYAEAFKQGFNGINPFELPASKVNYDPNELSQIESVFSDLLGAMHIDNHGDLKEAWGNIIANKSIETDLPRLAAPPVNEKEMLELAKKWEDDVFRNRTIQGWIQQAQSRYESISGSKS